MNENPGKSSKTTYIFHLNSKNLPDTIGTKAANLRRLKDNNFRIPTTYVCTWQAYLAYRESRNQILGKLREEISRHLQSNKFYAIRSSANLEDGLNHSFAGQFSTILDVQGLDKILRAIQEIWDNTRSEAVETYLNKSIHTQSDLKMAVVIQEMIQPFASGVAFSKNPITSLDEVLVEAVLGKGTSLVQEGITPLRWINKWGGWTQTPDNSPIPFEMIQEVVQETRRIVKVFKKEVDLEWVHDGQHLYWLQLRDITSLNKDNIYSNKMAKEMSPGQIKPLVWSVSIPIMPRTVVRFLSEIFGDIDIQPDRLVKAFYYRAYYNIAVVGDLLGRLGLPRESLEMMLCILPPGAGRPPMKPEMHVLRFMPRILKFIKDKWTFSNKYEKNYPRLFEQIHQFPPQLSADLSDRQIINMIDQVMVLNQEITYYSFVTSLLMSLYGTMLRSRLKKQGVDIQQFDLMEGVQELEQYDPVRKLKALNQHYLALDAKARAVIEQGDYDAFQNLDGIDSFQKQVSEFLMLFGHLSDTTTNFSTTPWREMPGLILELIASPQKSEDIDSRVRYGDLPKKDWRLRLFYQRARQFRLYKEKSSSLYTYSLMTARIYFLTLADQLVQKGYLLHCDDIFYLENHELREYISGELPGESLADLACQRKAEMEQCQNAIMPEVIFGEEMPLILAAHTSRLSGIPSSKGYHTGAIRIIRGIQDFHKLNPGDVLVIPYSDASWTPLFVNAGAVIADSGGILSHSSIIAREYNIPAVVSVSGILQLEDGMIVTVDGFKGDILIHDNDQFEQIDQINQQRCVEMGNN